MKENKIARQALNGVTIDQLKAGITAYNEAAFDQKIEVPENAKKMELAMAVLMAVREAVAAGKLEQVPDAVMRPYRVLEEALNKADKKPAKGTGNGKGKKAGGSADVAPDVKPVGRRKGGGYTGVTRPEAFKAVLKQHAGKTVKRTVLNKTMLDVYGGSEINATWWTGVYMQMICALGFATEVEQGKFEIDERFM